MFRKKLICLSLIALFILVVIIIIFVKLLSFYPLYSNRDCEIDPLWIANPPLLLQSDDSVIIYPFYGDSVVGLKNGDTVDISCPGGKLSVDGEATERVIRATCRYGTFLRIFDEPLSWDQISSCGDSVSIARLTQRKCSGGDEAVIGFSIDDNRFVNQILVCFNKYNQTTLYTNYDLVPWKSSFKLKPRYPVEDPGFYNVGNRKLFELYTKNNQRKTINQLLGLSSNNKTYIQDDDRYLSRGHIAAAADFYYPEQINATYRYINMAPQWQCINGKNWNQVEIDTRNYASTNKVTLKVWAGTYGIATLPYRNEQTKKIPLYLYTDGSLRGIPVPALFWKLLYNTETKNGIVLIVLNNPYQNLSDIKTLCRDISKNVSWLKWDKINIKNGYSYACSITEFRKVVDYAPNLDVNGLLL